MNEAGQRQPLEMAAALIRRKPDEPPKQPHILRGLFREINGDPRHATPSVPKRRPVERARTPDPAHVSDPGW